MAKKRKPRRRYTDNERADALAALAANGGNAEKTARQLEIPTRTLRQWSKGERHPEAAQVSTQKKGPLADHLEAVAWQIADAIPSRIATTPLHQLAVSLGIVIDKMRLLREQATSISKSASADDLTQLTDAELAKRIAEARSRATATPGSGTGSPSSS